MPTVEGREFYRNTFLKSEHWASLRAEALLRYKTKCVFCGHADFSNDVHHVHYPKNLYCNHISQLVVLCRECHEFVHEKMKLYGRPETPSECWKQYKKIRDEYHYISRNPRFANRKRLLAIITNSKEPMTIKQARAAWGPCDQESKAVFAMLLVKLLEKRLVLVTSTGFLVPRENDLLTDSL